MTAEARCIADCPNKRLVIMSREERKNLLPNGPAYSEYAARMDADHTNRHHLRFDCSQFDDLIEAIRGHSRFKSDVNAIKDGRKKSKETLASLFNKSNLHRYKDRSSNFVKKKLIAFQEANGTEFELLETIAKHLL